jgi:formate--tetrahydrofolate ligase
LNKLGVRATVCLREPSLGPCFGMKGGATGGGRAQVAPTADINLHFNGDLHAVSTANNLLAAMLDNHLYWRNKLDIDPATISWRRAIDLNDRALRTVDLSLGRGAHREGGFNITAASEVMAVLCLARNLDDLKRRLGDIVVARNRGGQAVSARDLGADGAMTALLADALQPNLVQSLEGNPAFVHGGPFANIAHGCNSLVATRTALALSDVVVTEAGFGTDLGAEKFLDIKCRQSGLRPDAVVLVCTVRALKMHGGIAKDDLDTPDEPAVRAGAPNLVRHIANLKRFGLTPVVAVNRFGTDTADEIAAVKAVAGGCGVQAVSATHWADGGTGAVALARAVLERIDQPGDVRLLYADELPLRDKIDAVATRIYGAGAVSFDPSAAARLEEFERLGYGHLPVCIAKTQYSFSADPTAMGAPEGHILPVREARLCAGAGFVIAVCGNVITMPGLPRRPAALDIGVDERGRVVGL